MIVQPDGSVKETVGSIAPVVGGVSMATYKQIVECVKRCTGRTVKTCWIAEVKRELGLSTSVPGPVQGGDPALYREWRGSLKSLSGPTQLTA